MSRPSTPRPATPSASSTVEDTAAAVLQFKSGALGTLLVSDTVSAPWSWEWGSRENPNRPIEPENCYLVAGTQGSLSVPTLQHRWHKPGEESWDTPLLQMHVPFRPADAYHEQMRNFCGVIRGTEKPVLSGRDGTNTLATTLAITESARRGKPVRVDEMLQRRIRIRTGGDEQVSEATRVACVMGWPAKQSRSPKLHGYWIKRYDIDGDYRVAEIPPEEFPAFVQEPRQERLRRRQRHHAAQGRGASPCPSPTSAPARWAPPTRCGSTTASCAPPTPTWKASSARSTSMRRAGTAAPTPPSCWVPAAPAAP